MSICKKRGKKGKKSQIKYERTLYDLKIREALILFEFFTCQKINVAYFVNYFFLASVCAIFSIMSIDRTVTKFISKYLI